MRKTKGKKRTALVASFYALMLMWSATTPALEHEEAGAQLAIGRMYERGIGVPQGYAKAVEWYRRAAEQGLARAQYNLGRMYDYGRGVTQDYAKAVKWYRRAAEQEFAGAQNDLGFMHEQGLGVPQDYAKAVEWYRRAAEPGGAGRKTISAPCTSRGGECHRITPKQWSGTAALPTRGTASHNSISASYTTRG